MVQRQESGIAIRPVKQKDPRTSQVFFFILLLLFLKHHDHFDHDDSHGNHEHTSPHRHHTAILR